MKARFDTATMEATSGMNVDRVAVITNAFTKRPLGQPESKPVENAPLLDDNKRFELNMAIETRKKASRVRKGSSYLTWAHDADYMEAQGKLRRANETITEILKPVIIKLRNEGMAWSKIQNELNVSATIIKLVRETL